MSPGFETRAIHAGQEPDPDTGAVVTPITLATTFAQARPGEPTAYEYGRSGNPTRHALEVCLASLESAAHGYAFASGMDAEACVLRALAGPVCATLSRRRGPSSAQRRALAATAAAALATTPVATAVGFLPSLRSYDQARVLASIRARTVIVSGGADLLTPPAHSAELAGAIPGAVHVHLPGAGHMLPEEAPQVLNAAIGQTMAPALPDVGQRASFTTAHRAPCETLAMLERFGQ